MKKLLLTLSLAFTLPFAAHAQSVTSAPKQIERIQIGTGPQQATYYFVPKGNLWGATGCEKAQYAFIRDTTPGAKAIYSAMVAAKATGDTVKVIGTCQDEIYIKLTYVTVD